MALRQRKAKDPILPLHEAEPGSNESSKNELFKTVSRKRHRPSEPSLLHRVYIPIIAFFLVAFGFAFLIVRGSGHPTHHEHLHEINHKKHYHSHTAHKIGAENRNDNQQTGEEKEYPPVKTHISPKAQDISPKDQESGDKPKVPHTIRCPDGTEGYLNDNYCDCADGSDEAQTSACSQVTVQKATFRCSDGSAVIYASRVEDGVRDCVDGSDEH